MIPTPALLGGLTRAAASDRERTTMTRMNRSPVLPGVLVGVGLGAMIDAFVFHAILQWHHLASARVPADTLDGLRTNVRLDGLFLAGMWLLTVLALGLLWRPVVDRGERPPAVQVVGAAIAGWGGFNLYDGIIDHYVFGLHHTTSGPHAAFWDLVIVAWGAAFVALGVALVRRARGRGSEPAEARP